MDCDSKIEKETKCILAEWRVDLKFWCQMHFFGYPFDVQVQPLSIKSKVIRIELHFASINISRSVIFTWAAHITIRN